MASVRTSVYGIDFPDLKSAARRFNQPPTTVARRIREGWTIEQALKLSFRNRKVSTGYSVTYKGRSYASIKDLAITFGINPRNLRARVQRGKSLTAAVLGVRRPRRGNRKPIVFNGRRFNSRSALASAHDLSWSVVGRRIGRGWTLPQALGLRPAPPRFRDSRGRPRRTKWAISTRIAGRYFPLTSRYQCKLYVITNRVNGKQYVGITMLPLRQRLRQHIYQALQGRHNKFSHAIRKYGPENFGIELVRNDARNYLHLEEQERKEIENRDCVRNGYNSAVGGSLGGAKRVVVEGTEFESQSAAAAYYGVDSGVFNMRLRRLGWTPEQAAGLQTREFRQHSFCLGRLTFASLRAAARYFEIEYKIAASRLYRGWSYAQAVGAEAPPRGSMRWRGTSTTVGRNNFPSLAACAANFRIKAESLRNLVVNSKMAPAEAVRYLCGLRDGTIARRYRGQR